MELIEDYDSESINVIDMLFPVVSMRSSVSYERVAELLHSLDLQPVKAKDGLEVLQRYVKHDTSLFIIDFDLPGMNIANLLDNFFQNECIR